MNTPQAIVLNVRDTQCGNKLEKELKKSLESNSVISISLRKLFDETLIQYKELCKKHEILPASQREYIKLPSKLDYIKIAAEIFVKAVLEKYNNYDYIIYKNVNTKEKLMAIKEVIKDVIIFTSFKCEVEGRVYEITSEEVEIRKCVSELKQDLLLRKEYQAILMHINLLQGTQDSHNKLIRNHGCKSSEECVNKLLKLAVVVRPYLEVSWDVKWDKVYEFIAVHNLSDTLLVDVNKDEKRVTKDSFDKLGEIVNLYEKYISQQIKEAILVKQLYTLHVVLQIMRDKGKLWKERAVTEEIGMENYYWLWSQDTYIGNMLKYLLEVAINANYFYDKKEC